MTPHQKQAAVDEVLNNLTELGHLDGNVIARVANQMGKCRRTIRRWVEDSGWQPPKTGPDPEVVGAVLHAHNGNIAQTYRRLEDSGLPGLHGCEQSFRRFVHDTLALSHLYAEGGTKALRNNQVYARHESRERNELWQGDHTMLDLYVKPLRGTKPIRPWITSFLDTKTRLCIGLGLSAGQYPNGDMIIATLAKAMSIRPTRIGGKYIDGGDVGGVPERIRHDRGGDWQSVRVQQVLAGFHIKSDPTLGRHAHQNGKVERFHRTVNEGFCASRPGYVTEAEDADGKAIYNSDPSELLTFNQFLSELHAWVTAYNTVNSHSSIGNRPPIEAWIDECHLQLREPPLQALRDAMLPEPRTFKVQKDGIHFDNRIFSSAALPPKGTEVTIRHLPHDLSQIEVYVGDDWYCTAVPAAELAPNELQAMYARRSAERKVVTRHSRAGRDLRTGAVRLEDLIPVASAAPDEYGGSDNDEAPEVEIGTGDASVSHMRQRAETQELYGDFDLEDTLSNLA